MRSDRVGPGERKHGRLTISARAKRPLRGILFDGMLSSFGELAMMGQLRVALSRLGLRPGEYSGDYTRLKKLYQSPDPWRLRSPKETHRFELTCAIIERVAPKCENLLELGCGEGLQTEHLARVTRRVTGIDLSMAALARARERVPHAQFFEGRAEDVLAIVGPQRFDLVTVCEMLYYSPHAASILENLYPLAPLILVTNHRKQSRRLLPLFEGPGWRRLEDLEVQGTVWRCDLWERVAKRSADTATRGTTVPTLSRCARVQRSACKTIMLESPTPIDD